MLSLLINSTHPGKKDFPKVLVWALKRSFWFELLQMPHYISTVRNTGTESSHLPKIDQSTDTYLYIFQNTYCL